MRRAWWCVLLLAMTAQAADRGDTREPAGDLADLFAWMSPDGTRLNLAMTVVPDRNQAFSPFVQYVFHLDSRGTFADLSPETIEVICQFDPQQTIACWLGDEAFVTGDATDNDGLIDPTGVLRVFAGLRDDPFFFNQAGVLTALDTVATFAPLGVSDATGCPAFEPGVLLNIGNQLVTDPVDAFESQSILAIVVSLDRNVVTPNGALVSVWASTHRKLEAP